MTEPADPWSVLTARLAAPIEAVDAAVPASVLPPDPPPAVIAAIDACLRGVRKRFW